MADPVVGIKITGDTSEFQKAVRSALAEVKKLGETVEGAFARIGQVTSLVGIGIGLEETLGQIIKLTLEASILGDLDSRRDGDQHECDLSSILRIELEETLECKQPFNDSLGVVKTINAEQYDRRTKTFSDSAGSGADQGRHCKVMKVLSRNAKRENARMCDARIVVYGTFVAINLKT